MGLSSSWPKALFLPKGHNSYETLGFMGISWDLAHHHLEKMSRINAYLGEATGEKDEIG